MEMNNYNNKIQELNKELYTAVHGYSEHQNTTLGEKVQVNCETHGYFIQHSKHMIIAGGKRISSITRCPGCINQDIKNLESQKKNKISSSKAEKIKELMKASGISKRFANSTLSNYKGVNNKAVANLNACKAYALAWTDRFADGGGIVMLGSCGTGKNHLAIAIMKEVIEKHQNTAYITTVSKLCNEFKNSWDKNTPETEQSLLKKYEQIDLLVIDEIGVQYGTQTERNILFNVIDSRYNEMKPTIIISNESREQLINFLGVRVIDRLREGGGCELVFDWESYRA